MFSGYGLTETSPAALMPRLDPPRPAGSVGEVLPCTEVKVLCDRALTND